MSEKIKFTCDFNPDAYGQPLDLLEMVPQLKQAEFGLQTLRRYVEFKAQAMQHRLDGLISNAKACEVNADRIYERDLPEWLKW